MPLEIAISAVSVDELHFELRKLLRGEVQETQGKDLPEPSIQSDYKTEEQLVVEKPKRAPRKRKGEETGVDAPATSTSVETSTDFVVFKSDGSKRAGYSYAADAAKVMEHDIGEIKSMKDLDAWSVNNTDTIGRFTPELQDKIAENIDNRYLELNTVGEDEKTVEEGDKQITEEQARKQIKTFIEKNGKEGTTKAAEIMKTKFGTMKFNELKQEHFNQVPELFKV